MDDLQNYLFEAIRDQDSLDQETCKLNLTKDSYLTEIVKQISIHRDQLSTERVQAILDMSISDNEKDELVQVVMKHSSDASDIIENFEKMDPNTADDYYRFRKFILELNDNEANNIEAQLSQSSQSNSARNGQGYVQENILQAQKDPNRSQGNISGKNQASNQEFGDDSDINVMNNLINQRNKPEQGLVLMPPSRQDSEHSRPAEVPVVSYNKNNPVVQNSKLDDSSHRSQKPIIQTPKSVKVKDIPAHGYIDDEDDLDFDIPGERSSRDNRNQYFQSNLNEHDYSPRDAQKHVHQPIKPASLNKDASPHSNYQVPENMFNRIPMEPQNQDESIDNFQIPEEKSRDIDVYDIKENNIDPVRLDMLEEDEPPAIVPVTGNFAFKKQLNIGQAVADNGEFKRFYEEKAYQNMGQIPEEPFEGESALSSNHKKASDLFAGSHQYKNSSFKQEELSKKSSPYERSADSYGGMKPLPTGAAPKFIASSLNDTKKQSYPLIDVPAIEHKPKIKGPSQMLSFSSPIKSNEDEDIEYQVGRGFKAPSPRLIWNPLTAPQPTEDQPVKLLIGNPTVQKIKEDQKQAPVQKAVEGTYTKEQVEKVVEDKLRTIESKYIGLEAEIAKLTEELKQKKSEENKYISYHDAKVNSFSSEDKPRSTIKLLKPARLGSNLAWINKNHEDRLKMQHEQSKMNISKQSMTNTMLDGVNDGDMDTVSKIVSFARGTTVTKTFELSGGKKGTLFQNDHIAVEIDIEHDLHIKDGNYYIKLKLEFRNKCTNEVGGIVPKILDPTQSTSNLT